MYGSRAVRTCDGRDEGPWSTHLVSTRARMVGGSGVRAELRRARMEPSLRR